MTELECMLDYSLVPYDSVCSWNTVDSWDVSWSSLYINEIQHLSSENINITIPSEISWDYTGDENNFELVINWYNVNTEYIEWIIENQNALPNSEDFNNIITYLLPLFVPWLVLILFIYFVFRLIKKVF